jgi:hypothetical protein
MDKGYESVDTDEYNEYLEKLANQAEDIKVEYLVDKNSKFEKKMHQLIKDKKIEELSKNKLAAQQRNRLYLICFSILTKRYKTYCQRVLAFVTKNLEVDFQIQLHVISTSKYK